MHLGKEWLRMVNLNEGASSCYAIGCLLGDPFTWQHISASCINCVQLDFVLSSTTSFQQGKESEIISPPFCLSRCILLFLKPVSPPRCPWCSFKICFDLWKRWTRGRQRSVLSDRFPTLLCPTALGCTCRTYNSLTSGVTVSVRFSLWIKLV